MKTQIISLKNGSTHVIGYDFTKEVPGSNKAERLEISLKVREENPEAMTIKVKGIELSGKASYSVSRKSVSWMFWLTVDQYSTIAETSFGISPYPEKNKPYLEINGNCEAWITCGRTFAYVPESWIEIL